MIFTVSCSLYVSCVLSFLCSVLVIVDDSEDNDQDNITMVMPPACGYTVAQTVVHTLPNTATSSNDENDESLGIESFKNNICGRIWWKILELLGYLL